MVGCKDLKKMLKEKGISYRRLSTATGIPLTTLNMKIQKRYAFTVDEMLLICEALDADPRKELYRFTQKK